MNQTYPPRIFFLVWLIAFLAFLSGAAYPQKEEWKKLTEQAEQLYYQEKYSEALSVARQALQLAEATFGADHPNTARNLNLLALLYDEQGSYSEAELMYRRALEIAEKVLGADHPDTAIALNNLAVLYFHQGKYSEAEPLHKRSLATAEKLSGPDHPKTAICLHNLAFLYLIQERYSEAEPLLKRALAIWERTSGSEIRNLATGLGSLGLLYIYQGKYSEAEPLLRRALAITEGVSGPDQPDTARSLETLGILLIYQEKYVEAEQLLRRALAIREKSRGADHPENATILTDMAGLYIRSGNADAALPLMQRAISIDDLTIQNVFSLASEREKFAFLGTVQIHDEVFLNLVAQELQGKPEALTAALDMVLKRKGLVLEALSREREALLRSEKPEVRFAYEKLQQISSRLAAITLAGPQETGPEEFRKAVAFLQEEKEKLEKELARSSETYRLKSLMRQADTREVAERLPPGSVLIEYVSVPIVDFRKIERGKAPGKEKYLALVLPSRKSFSSGPPPRKRSLPCPHRSWRSRCHRQCREEIPGGDSQIKQSDTR